MPIIVTKEIAAFLAGRMEVELDWGDVYTFEQRLSMFTVFIQACQIGGVDPQYGIKQFLDRSKDLVEDTKDLVEKEVQYDDTIRIHQTTQA